MAKTAKFNRQDVIEKATNLYWKKGFHATSMRNLQDEIDMRPGSIYGAFGSKNGLFEESLRFYTDMGLAQIALCVDESNSSIEALKSFVKKQVICTQENAPNGMCMLAKTVGELTSEHQYLLNLTKEHLGEISAEFVKIISQAQANDEIPKSKTPEQLASYVQIQIAGLRTYAKIKSDKNMLDEMIEDMFSHYPF